MSDIPDNGDLFDQHDRELARQERHLPICCLCGDRIFQDDAVFLDGEWYCDRCMEDNRLYIDEEDL